VSGGGTHRAGQAAFGNMCRKGRMFAPTKVWRKWHRESNLNERRVAVTSAIAASAVPALVMARGHRVDSIAELPLILGGGVDALEKTRDAAKVLQKMGAMDDVDRVVDSKKIRSGKGKWRNRRYTMRRGPLIVHTGSKNVEQSFRNITGVELANVDRLNLLNLAPGGHLGRFIVWTQAAFEKLDSIFGSYSAKSAVKKNFSLPRTVMTNPDVARIINSDEVQTRLRAARDGKTLVPRKQNPLRNNGALLRLNPYAKTTRRDGAQEAEGKRNEKRPRTRSSSKRAFKKAFFAELTNAVPSQESDLGHSFLTSFNDVLASQQ